MFLVTLLFLTSAAGVAGAADENLYYRGVVYVKGEIRFRLKGTSFMKNGLIIKSDLYSDPRSVPVLKDDTTVRVDPLEIISYRQVNYSCGSESSIQNDGPGYLVGFRKKTGRLQSPAHVFYYACGHIINQCDNFVKLISTPGNCVVSFFDAILKAVSRKSASDVRREHDSNGAVHVSAHVHLR